MTQIQFRQILKAFAKAIGILEDDELTQDGLNLILCDIVENDFNIYNLISENDSFNQNLETLCKTYID